MLVIWENKCKQNTKRLTHTAVYVCRWFTHIKKLEAITHKISRRDWLGPEVSRLSPAFGKMLVTFLNSYSSNIMCTCCFLGEHRVAEDQEAATYCWGSIQPVQLSQCKRCGVCIGSPQQATEGKGPSPPLPLVQKKREDVCVTAGSSILCEIVMQWQGASSPP